MQKLMMTTLALSILGAPSLAQAEEELAPVVVRGKRSNADYRTDTSGSATRTDTPDAETPQSVRQVPRQLIEDAGAKRVEQAMDYVSGVTRQNSFGGLWDNYAIRGLAGNENTGLGFLVNGFAGNRGFNAPRDTANVERIEVLKGPISALYGSAEPGGSLNIVTKKPSFKSSNVLGFSLDNYGSTRGTLDSTGALSEDLAYRFNMAAEERDSQRDYNHSRRQLFAPALTWKAGDFTTVNYESEFLRQQAPLDRGIVAVNGRLDAMSDKTFLGEPGDGDVTVDNQTHQLSVEHEFSERWTAYLGVSYKHGTLQGYSTEASALQADQQTLRRQRRYRDYLSDDTTLQGQLIGKFDTGRIAHTLLLGFERYQFELDQTMLRINPSNGAPYAVNIYSPAYGQAQPTPLANTSTLEQQTGNAINVQDQLSLTPSWKLLIGARADQFLQRIENRRNGSLTRQAHDAVTPRIGVVKLLSDQFSLYANASQSFRPNAGTDVGGNSFAPEKGKSFETGLKFASADQRLSATTALFDIRKRNVLTADPLNSGFSMATGEVRSRGLEFDAAGRIGEAWRLSASYTYLDAEVLRDNSLARGTRLLNVPRNTASLLAVHEQAAGAEGKLGLGGGVVWVGRRAGDATASFDLPSYSTTRALSYWQINKRYRLSLDVDNLFDERYYSASYSSVWITPGSRRTVTLGLTAAL
ncbi:TonB-dependent siderophore receptor [Uliginosibacterium sediminicola]|uniref:TonB-dependent siderophore receptor n=1 Tax=Uliginosibacterium sediminicola TaxID=2024550 RepID=A0ABU9YUG1_9RHOO